MEEPCAPSTVVLRKAVEKDADKLLSPGDTEILRQNSRSPRNSLIDIIPGQEYKFVEDPSPDFHCPVTFELLVDPHQTTCCGNHISSGAATKLKIEGKACPVCKEPDFNTMSDKHYQRRVLDLGVQCPHDCCSWVGEIRDHDKHLKMCPKRSWSCQYCDIVCTYDKGESLHWSECTMFPEPCPNACEVQFVARKNIEEHHSVCSMEPVPCELSEYGCQATLPRKDLVKHMKENEGQHLIILAVQGYKQLKLNKDAMFQIHQSLQSVEQAVLGLKKDLVDLKSKVGHIEHHAAGGKCSSCTVHPFSKFSQLKLSETNRDSQPFYIKEHGYRFNFRIIYYKPPYDMVVAFLGLLPSSNDDELVWPVKISCQLEQLNQVGDQGHKKFKATFTWNKEDRGVWRTIDSYEMKYSDLVKKKPTVNYIVNDTLLYRLHLDIIP